MSEPISRREILGSAIATGLCATSLAQTSKEAVVSNQSPPFRYCLNTSTIRGQKLGIVREVELAGKAGYDGIEPWIRELDEYVQQGNSLADLKKRIDDAGLRVESAIGFAAFLVDDNSEREKALAEARRSMKIVKALGGSRIAAPPVGVTNEPMTDFSKMADRYRALCQVGAEEGVSPELELWGFSKTLCRMGEVAHVVTEAAHENSSILLDVYHIHKGGSDFSGLEYFVGSKMHCFHINDYPAQPPRDTIKDQDRVFVGHGVAPMTQILRTLQKIGFRGALSLELFNPEYWSRDAEAVVVEGLKSMKSAVAASGL